MTEDPLLLLVYGLPLLFIWGFYLARSRKRTARARSIIADNLEAGLNEPPSLHPVIDPVKCLGCGSCVFACPEKTVLDIVDGKAELIEPTMCVGHGACQSACPTGAISLVFGTETRGVDIPVVSPEFETTVPGIFIAGELGGMGLIKNAIEQGRQAMTVIAARAIRDRPLNGELDVVIVGCGPAGIAAALGAKQHNLSFAIIDQSTLGGTVAHFPRGKLVMTAPARLPIVGEVKFGEISKEKLLSFWEGVLTKTGLSPHFEEQVIAINRMGGAFEVISNKQTYQAKTVLLAIGRRGTPRPLGVEGEALSKVVYRLIDPEQYAGRKVLVVGGGDSALEAAARIAEQPGTDVILSYRGKAYGRARARNRERVRNLVEAGRIRELLESNLLKVSDLHVELEIGGHTETFENDFVIICAGGLLPTQFLRDIGIDITTKFGTT